MKQKAIKWIIISAITLVFAAGCKCENPDMLTFEVLLDSPADGELISTLLPTFGWHDDESCEPDNFMIAVEENGASGWPIYEYTSGNGTTHAWGTALEPGKEYTWYMRALLSGGSSGPRSDPSLFYTGPVCSGETLVAPELQVPMDSGWISHSSPQEFNWTYPGDCLPPNFDYEFSYTPDFSTVVVSGTTPLYVQHIYESFPDCSTVFWRVRARDSSGVGPWSDVFDFHWVIDESCWQWKWPSLNSALLRGRVWFDDCPVTSWYIPLDPYYVVNPKCQIAAGIGIVGNGFMDYGEDGLQDVVVDLGSGPCPSTGLDSFSTDYWGRYQFYVLSPGAYCVSINKSQIADGTDLAGGVWTEELTDELVTQKDIIVPPGLSEVVEDFGWDDHELPFVLEVLEQNTNCRVCPDPEGPVAKIPMAGDYIRLLARVADSDWKAASVEGMKCYIYNLMDYPELTTEDDPAPCPLPTPTPTPKPKKPGSGDQCSGLDYNSCDLNPNCEWDRPNKKCKSK